MSASVLPRGVAAGPVPSRRVCPHHCGYCRQVVTPSTAVDMAGTHYCSWEHAEARADEMAATDERGWEPSVSTGWGATALHITPTTSTGASS